MDHVADVQKLQEDPLIWHAICNCGNWSMVSDKKEELQVWFLDHRRDEYERDKVRKAFR